MLHKLTSIIRKQNSLPKDLALSRSRVMIHRCAISAARAISEINSSALVVAVLCACSALSSVTMYLRSGSNFLLRSSALPGFSNQSHSLNNQKAIVSNSATNYTPGAWYVQMRDSNPSIAGPAPRHSSRKSSCRKSSVAAR